MQTLNSLEHNFTEFNAFSVFNTNVEETFQPGVALLEQLQVTLDIEELLNIFSMQVAKYINFSGLSFKSDEFSHSMRGSRQNTMERKFELKIDKELIGILTYNISSTISLTNYKILSQMHKYLLNPLRNAIKYSMATKLALQDGLTGLGNRRYYDEQLKKAISHANRHKKSVGLIVADLNKFKVINDTYGHHLGDRILENVANALRKSIRDSDSIFRFGGDEFVAIVEDTNDHSLEIIKNRIHKEIANNELLAKYNSTCSLGSTFMNKTDTVQSFFERADRDLYDQKNIAHRNLSMV